MHAGRGTLLGGAILIAGCGIASEPRVDGRFTASEWEFLQTFRLPSTCPDASTDGELIEIGRRLFFDRSYAGPILVGEDAGNGGLGAVGEEGRVSCADCHQPDAWFRDDRSRPNATSLGAGWTKRNAPSLVNACLVQPLGWDGRFDRLSSVVEATVERNALTGEALLNSTPERLDEVLCCSYGSCEGEVDPGLALEAFMQQLISGDSPFDRYLDGAWDALTESEKLGLEVFIGPGHCADCHDGPALSDGDFHVTGVTQLVDDVGRGDGAFRTPGLRQIAETAPYFHDGRQATLTDVIWFYREGGDVGGFIGERDPLMTRLEISDEEADALEAFLRTLTGEPVIVTTPNLPSGSGLAGACRGRFP